MRSTLRILVFLFLLLAPALLSAHPWDRVKRDSLRRYHNTIDTNYIRKYPERFIITLSQSYRQYDVRFFQTLATDTAGWGAPQMVADANVSNGMSIDFDKISFSFGLNAIPPTADQLHKKGETTYKTFSFSFSGYRFRFESSYRNYHGFYDLKTPKYDTLFDSTGVYFQDPSMDVRSIRLKTIFVFNKRRFSYNSAYYNTQRQLKSAGSWLVVSNIYGYRIKSDTSLIPKASRPFYDYYGDLNYFNVQGFSVGPGYSFNLVLFKTLYFNATATSGFDFQHRLYNTFSGNYSAKFWKVGTAADVRLAIGINAKRFFTSLTYRVDYNSYVSTGLRIAPSYYAVDFNIGYRFHFKQRKWVTKMQENKWYQML